MGSLLPDAINLHELVERQSIGVCYMNTWDCERLGYSVSNINALGDDYYTKYFIKKELLRSFIGISEYLKDEDFSKKYSFFQRVKLHDATDYKWFYSICKIFQINKNAVLSEKMVVLSSPIEGVGGIITIINKVLDENIYIKNNFCFLDS